MHRQQQVQHSSAQISLVQRHLTELLEQFDVLYPLPGFAEDSGETANEGWIVPCLLSGKFEEAQWRDQCMASSNGVGAGALVASPEVSTGAGSHGGSVTSGVDTVELSRQYYLEQYSPPNLITSVMPALCSKRRARELFGNAVRLCGGFPVPLVNAVRMRFEVVPGAAQQHLTSAGAPAGAHAKTALGLRSSSSDAGSSVMTVASDGAAEAPARIDALVHIATSPEHEELKNLRKDVVEIRVRGPRLALSVLWTVLLRCQDVVEHSLSHNPGLGSPIVFVPCPACVSELRNDTWERRYNMQLGWMMRRFEEDPGVGEWRCEGDVEHLVPTTLLLPQVHTAAARAAPLAAAPLPKPTMTRSGSAPDPDPVMCNNVQALVRLAVLYVDPGGVGRFLNYTSGCVIDARAGLVITSTHLVVDPATRLKFRDRDFGCGRLEEHCRIVIAVNDDGGRGVSPPVYRYVGKVVELSVGEHEEEVLRQDRRFDEFPDVMLLRVVGRIAVTESDSRGVELYPPIEEDPLPLELLENGNVLGGELDLKVRSSECSLGQNVTIFSFPDPRVMRSFKPVCDHGTLLTSSTEQDKYIQTKVFETHGSSGGPLLLANTSSVMGLLSQSVGGVAFFENLEPVLPRLLEYLNLFDELDES